MNRLSLGGHFGKSSRDNNSQLCLQHLYEGLKYKDGNKMLGEFSELQSERDKIQLS